MPACRRDHFDKSVWRRDDFGPSISLCANRCSSCRKFTRNRGCQHCGIILCLGGYSSHVECAHHDRFPPTVALPRLHDAAESGNIDEVLTLLRVKGLDADGGRTFLGEDGVTPLMTAAAVGHVAVVQALAPHSNCNLQSTRGETALSLATQNNHVDVVMALVQLDGVDANVVRDDGITPLMTAAEVGNVQVVEVLAPHSNLNLQNARRHTALSLAAQNNHVDVVMKLLSATGLTGEVALDVKCGLAGTVAEIARREGHHGVANILAEAISMGHRRKMLHELTEGLAAGPFDSMAERLRALYDAFEEPTQPMSMEPGLPMCIMCLNAEVNTAIVPCFHTKFCEHCAARVVQARKRCPECRGPVQKVQRVFL